MPDLIASFVLFIYLVCLLRRVRLSSTLERKVESSCAGGGAVLF
jgi:hypothetical protein